jgi:hypothetical protein
MCALVVYFLRPRGIRYWLSGGEGEVPTRPEHGFRRYCRRMRERVLSFIYSGRETNDHAYERSLNLDVFKWALYGV